MSFNRYSNLILNGKQQLMPKVTISKRETDKFFSYQPGKTRLDLISGKVYNDDTYGWLILLANPEYYTEFDIPHNTVLRIPFPLREVEAEINRKIITNKDR
jgi:hypothetical protein